ncbi:MAG TPA: MBL fold metallo-hydrolase [Solirubrobacteraceae bacterium]|nr:MBL fold metallo-hydrolase [Solirubrobacteraceae bacterium]
MEIRFLGHACFSLEHDGTTVLIDPFLTGNPKAAAQASSPRAPRSSAASGTFPPIETDAQAFKADVEAGGFAEVVVLEPGQSHAVRP